MNPEVQVGIAGGCVALTVAAVAWFSAFSALRGPRWALDRVGALRWAGAAEMVGGAILFGLTRIGWIAVLAAYLGLSLVLVSSLLRRQLTRLDSIGGLDDIPAGVVVSRLRGAQFGLAGLVVMFSVAAVFFSGGLAVVNGVLAAIMAANWVALRVAAARA